MMTYKKYNAKSPHFSDVGQALYDAWWSYDGGYLNREKFTENEKDTLLEWLWHEQQHKNGIIFIREREILRLNIAFERQTGRKIKENEGLLL